MKHLILLGTLPLAAQIDMRMEISMKSPSPAVLSSIRFLFQNNILRIEAGPSILINNLAEGKFYLGNATAQTYVEATQAEFDQLGKKVDGAAQSGLKATKLDAPAAPPYEWNGQKLQGKTCRYTIDIPNAPAGGYEQTMTIYGTPLSGELAKFQAAQRKAGFEPSVPAGESFLTAMKDCLTTDLFPVRTELKMVMPQMKMETVVAIEVVSMKQGPVDSALLRMPSDWKRDTTTTLRAAFQRFSRPDASARPRAEKTKEDLLAEIDELKKVVAAEKWEQARSAANTLNMELFRRAEKNKPTLEQQFEEAEASSGKFAPSMLRAAELALKLGRLDKVQAYAQAILDSPRQRIPVFDDQFHSAHVLLGMLAWKRGDKAAALSHLDAAGKFNSGSVTTFMGPHVELAEFLAAAGENEKVAAFLEAVSVNIRDASKKRMYQTAAKNLRAGQPAYFSGETYNRYEFPK